MKLERMKTGLNKLVPEFAKEVAPVYKALNWKWYDRDKPYIPDAKDIEEHAYKEIGEFSIEDYDDEQIDDGSVEIFYNPHADEDYGEYGLRFVIEKTRPLGIQHTRFLEKLKKGKSL
jgi:hypothetical protein